MGAAGVAQRRFPIARSHTSRVFWKLPLLYSCGPRWSGRVGMCGSSAIAVGPEGRSCQSGVLRTRAVPFEANPDG